MHPVSTKRFSSRSSAWLIMVCLCLLGLQSFSNAQPRPLQTVSPNEQLTDQDMDEIISLLGENDQKPSASSPVASVASPKGNSGAKAKPSSSSLPPIVTRQATPSPPTQEELIQSLSLLNSLLNSGGISADTASQLGLGSLVPSTTSTTTTTENPNASDAAATAILNSLLSASGGSASSSASTSSDAAGLAALLGLAAAASGAASGGGSGTGVAPSAQQQQNQNQVKQQSQSATDAQNAALLSNLLLSVGQPQGAQPGIKQQDFQSFQNAGLNLDSSSSNQLSGALGLLGALSSFASPQPNGLLNLGQSNILSGLLGGGQKQQQPNLLAGLLSPGLQQQGQRPGLLSSLGNLATVVGSTLSGSRGDGKPRVRGVDTRLGLGYRFGENADAQVVWEIGPQLFTEPLTDEQKQQLLLLQQQQRLQQQQQQQHVNRRFSLGSLTKANTKRSSPKPVYTHSHRPVTIQQLNHPSLARRTLTVSNSDKMDVLSSSLSSAERLKTIKPSATTTTLHQAIQPPQFYSTRVISPVVAIQTHRKNYYAKEEANPRNNAHSQLTEYERWLLYNPSRDQIHQQHLLVNAKTNQNQNKMDAFIFRKDNADNIVRVRIQPRENPHKVKIVQTVGNSQIGFSNGASLHPVSSINKRMGSFDYEAPNLDAEDSYIRRNAMVVNPNIREIEIQRERQQHLLNIQRRQTPSMEQIRSYSNTNTNTNNNFEAERRTLSETLSEWNEKNSMLDLMQNYVLTGLTSQGNNMVKNFFMAREQEQKKLKAEGSSRVSSPFMDQQQPKSKQESSGSSSSLLPSLSFSTLKEILGMAKNKAQAQLKPTAKPTVKPVVRVGDHVYYDELQAMIKGESPSSGSHVKVIPTLSDPAEVAERNREHFATPAPEIFIDLVNGEVSMRKPFGTMESFTPTTPEPVPEDSPKHVFKVLREQLHEEYQKVKLEQLKEAAKQRRKENIAHGLSNPQDPIYLASKYFDLVEQERMKRNS